MQPCLDCYNSTVSSRIMFSGEYQTGVPCGSDKAKVADGPAL